MAWAPGDCCAAGKGEEMGEEMGEETSPLQTPLQTPLHGAGRDGWIWHGVAGGVQPLGLWRCWGEWTCCRGAVAAPGPDVRGDLVWGFWGCDGAG
jgi:hypothetical protein